MGTTPRERKRGKGGLEREFKRRIRMRSRDLESLQLFNCFVLKRKDGQGVTSAGPEMILADFYEFHSSALL